MGEFSIFVAFSKYLNFNRETLSSPLRQILSGFFMVGSIDDVHVPFVSVSDIMAMALEVVVSQYFENHKCAKSTFSWIINFHKIALNSVDCNRF